MNQDVNAGAEREREERQRYLWKTWILSGALPCGLIFSVVQTLRGEGARQILSVEFLIYTVGIVGIMCFSFYWIGRICWRYRIGTARRWSKRE